MKVFKIAATSLFMMAYLIACGGGGSGGSGIAPVSKETIISGVATKGPLINGTVTIFALNADGSKGALLKSVSTDATGYYYANLGTYTGPVIIEAFGSYVDEATGFTKAITSDTPLRAVLASASGTVSMQITPFTDLAVRKAGALTPASIDAANKLVSDLFKFDILNNQPVPPTAAAIRDATPAQKDYTLALAAISQLSQTNGVPLADTLDSLARGISATEMNSENAASFLSAANAFISNPNNQTGLTSIASTNLGNAGGATATYKLGILGDIGANAVKGIQLELVLPAGVTIRHDVSNGRPLVGIVTAASSASSSYVDSKYTASANTLTIGFITGSGIGVGNFVTFTCDVSPGVATPISTAFTVQGVKAVDSNGVQMQGVTVSMK